MWTEERTAMLKALKKDGLSYRAIGLKLGVTRNAVSGKLNRLGLSSPCKTPYKMRRGPDRVPRDSWDRLLFEPYGVRKARLATEGRV